jgi:hypothetical protein
MTSKALDNVAKLRDIVNVRDFGASPTASATVNTAAIQAAIDYVYGLMGGGAVQIIGDYNINGALVIGSLVRLQGPGRLVQTASNTPIIKVTKSTFNQGWSIRQLELRYQSAQPSTNTDARAIILCEANKFSYSFIVEDVRIWQAAKGIDAPEETASFAFLGTFNNVVIEQCSDWGFDWRNAITGGSTYLSMNNVWVNNIAGQEIAGSKGFRIRGCATLCINGIAADHVQDQPFYFDACVGNIGVLTAESCDLTKSSGGAELVNISGGSLTIGEIALESNNITISGTAFGAGLRVTDAAYVRVGILRDNFNAVNDTSSDDYFTIAAATNASAVYVDKYIYSPNTSPPAGFATAPNGAIADFNAPPKLRLFRENVRTDVRGGRTHIFGTSPPASGTWAKGDITWNNDPIDATSPIGWICLVAGTPGTWLEFGAPIITQATAAAIAAVGNAINTTGKFGGKLVWDSTNNRLLRTQGGAAADPWYVVDGSASVTPS